MASQDELDRMKKFIVQQLPEVEDESDLETATEGLIEEAYEELMANLKANKGETTPAFDEEPETDDDPVTADQAQSDTREEDDSPREESQPHETETHEQSEPESKPEFPDTPFGQYQQFLQQLQDMANDWAERLGDNYIPFVEPGGESFVYGAEHVNDPKQTKFSEMPIPKSIADEVPEHSAKVGAVYRWAQAKWDELYREAKRKARSYDEYDAFVFDRGYKFSIEHRHLNRNYDAVSIPQRVREVLED